MRTLVILTLNEIDGVRALVPNLPVSDVDEVIAVDGGSTDGTREFLAEHNIRIVSQERRGRGEAFRVAFKAAEGDQLLFFSPDGNEDPADIPRIFKLMAEENADIVIASRFLPESRNEEDDDWLPLRKWTNQAFTLMANVRWNWGRPFITDTINGYRAISRSAFDLLSLESMGYTIEYEMTIRAMKRSLKIVELPTIEGNRIGGETKAPSFQTGVVFVRLFLKELFAKS